MPLHPLISTKTLYFFFFFFFFFFFAVLIIAVAVTLNTSPRLLKTLYLYTGKIKYRQLILYPVLAVYKGNTGYNISATYRPYILNFDKAPTFLSRLLPWLLCPLPLLLTRTHCPLLLRCPLPLHSPLHRCSLH